MPNTEKVTPMHGAANVGNAISHNRTETSAHDQRGLAALTRRRRIRLGRQITPAAVMAPVTSPETPSLRARLAQPLEPMPQPTADPSKHVSLLRFALLNLVGSALLAAAYVQGMVHNVIAADRTYVSILIFAVFVVGLGLSAWKAWQTNRELNGLRTLAHAGELNNTHVGALLISEPENRANLAAALRLQLSHRISSVRHIANNLVLLGLIGTVLGFIIALSGVAPERAGDVSAVTPMISTLIEGMSTALYTTLVGAILHVWLMANHQLLVGATVQLLAAAVERVESNA